MQTIFKTIMIGSIAGLALAGCSQENTTVEPEATETAVVPMPMPTATETAVVPVPGATATETVAPDAAATPAPTGTGTASPAM